MVDRRWRYQPRSALFWVLLGAAQALAGERIGDIEFFGGKGLDVAKIRGMLPVHEGDEYSGQTKDLIRQAVAEAIGKPPTDVAAICCDDHRNRLLFIGLPGVSYRSFAYNPEPKGGVRLPPEILSLSKRVNDSIRPGANGPPEDDSHGYALYGDAETRSLLLDVRRWAIPHERELLRVLEFSNAAEHRRVAAETLGYARRSRTQVFALVRAARDPDDEVRNNATRALGVLAQSDRGPGVRIPPDTFIEMLSSGIWTDRNKSAALLEGLTAAREPGLLARIRSAALDSLVEMALWRRPGHAYFARMVLGRIAGLPEDRLRELAMNGPVETIVEAAHRR